MPARFIARSSVVFTTPSSFAIVSKPSPVAYKSAACLKTSAEIGASRMTTPSCNKTLRAELVEMP